MRTTPLSSGGFGAGQAAARPAFVTTHWSVVLRAGRNDTTQAQAALSHLCEVYWYPLYAYVRQRGYSPEDAQDLTQEFFARLIQKGTLAQADPARGRFRSFLLASLNHFLAHEWEKARALKRGGGQIVVSLDLAAAEQWYALEPPDPRTPDQAFEKRWALALLKAVLDRLDGEYPSGRQARVVRCLAADPHRHLGDSPLHRAGYPVEADRGRRQSRRPPLAQTLSRIAARRDCRHRQRARGN